MAEHCVQSRGALGIGRAHTIVLEVLIAVSVLASFVGVAFEESDVKHVAL
jgi:hypothetical protein